MKTTKLLLFILLVLLSSCDSDDKNDMKSDVKELRQTAWKGMIFERSEGSIIGHGPIVIQFTTDNLGVYEYKLDYFINSVSESFRFEIEDKLMLIRTTSPEVSALLSGDWIIEKYDLDSLILTKNAHLNEATSNVIKLKKEKDYPLIP